MSEMYVFLVISKFVLVIFYFSYFVDFFPLISMFS